MANKQPPPPLLYYGIHSMDIYVHIRVCDTPFDSRIMVERVKFSGCVSKWHNHIESFPVNILQTFNPLLWLLWILWHILCEICVWVWACIEHFLSINKYKFRRKFIQTDLGRRAYLKDAKKQLANTQTHARVRISNLASQVRDVSVKQTKMVGHTQIFDAIMKSWLYEPNISSINPVPLMKSIEAEATPHFIDIPLSGDSKKSIEFIFPISSFFTQTSNKQLIVFSSISG